jgi:hypothetical protein
LLIVIYLLFVYCNLDFVILLIVIYLLFEYCNLIIVIRYLSFL